MRLLAAAMGYDEPWLQPERRGGDRARSWTPPGATNPLLTGITLERLQAEGTVPLHVSATERGAVRRWAFPDALRQGRAALRGHRRAWPRSSAGLPAAGRVRGRSGARTKPGSRPGADHRRRASLRHHVDGEPTGAGRQGGHAVHRDEPGRCGARGRSFTVRTSWSANERGWCTLARRRHRRRAPRRGRLAQGALGVALRGPAQRQLARPRTPSPTSPARAPFTRI